MATGIRQTKKRFGVFLLALFTTLALMNAGCLAQAGSVAAAGGDMQGVWAGVASGSGSRGAAVTLTLRGEIRKILYRSPLNCAVAFEPPAAPSANSFSAGVYETNGGRCDAMIDGQVAVRLESGGGVSYTLTKSDGKVWDQGELRRAD